MVERIKPTRTTYENSRPMSSKARGRFWDTVVNSPVPDIDAAQKILPDAHKLYMGLGVPPEDAKRLAEKLKKNLYGGTAQQQATAAESLLSMDQAYQELKEIRQQQEISDLKNI